MNTQPIQPSIPPQPPVPSFVPPPPQPPKEKFPKGLIIAIVFLSLAVASLFAYKYLKLKQQLAQTSPIPSATTIPTTDLTADWKTYTNENYLVAFQYPERFTLNNEFQQDDNYETIGSLESQFEETILINIIKNIDIYNKAKAKDVAFREIMDSGYKYEIEETEIGDYSAAITMIDDQNISPLSITIAHPTKNLFVVLVLPRDLSKVDFEQILSTFKFTN